jgi:hypothetical protein
VERESKIRYLEMIQNVISRMASNSFLLKGWTVTLVVGLLAFANIAEMSSKFVILALVPAIFFWILDGFFLYQEWLFRELFKHATTLDETSIDFSLNPNPYKDKVKSLYCAILSKTLLLFYLPIITVIILALLSFTNMSCK